MSSRVLASLVRAAQKSQASRAAPLVLQSKKQYQTDRIAKNILTLNSAEKPFTISSVALTVLVPLAIVEPTIGYLVDPILAVAIPLHMFIGCKYVIQDYVPKQFKQYAISIWAVISVLTGLGLLKLSMEHGVVNAFKSIWYPAGSYQKK